MDREYWPDDPYLHEFRERNFKNAQRHGIGQGYYKMMRLQIMSAVHEHNYKNGAFKEKIPEGRRDTFPSHQALDIFLASDLLTPPEREIFARLKEHYNEWTLRCPEVHRKEFSPPLKDVAEDVADEAISFLKELVKILGLTKMATYRETQAAQDETVFMAEQASKYLKANAKKAVREGRGLIKQPAARESRAAGHKTASTKNTERKGGDYGSEFKQNLKRAFS
jgi:HEPN domain-containing protein